MAKIKTKCECGNEIDGIVGQVVYENELRWYMSYNCEKCGRAVELDDNDKTPEEIRDVIIKEEGEWKIILKNLKDLTKVVYILKKNYDFEDIKIFKERIRNGLITGTKSEMMKIKKILSNKCIECILVKVVNRIEKIVIDVSNIKTSAELQEMIKINLEFPEFYGMNWDAFWDTITGGLELPKKLILVGWNNLKNKLPEDTEIMTNLLSDFNKEYPNLKCEIEYL